MASFNFRQYLRRTWMTGRLSAIKGAGFHSVLLSGVLQGFGYIISQRQEE